ncbi:hypothetical protein BO71DRAFT_404321 [Aspergillus ellipticus CBS 707.79]|uniref:Uncharacterized protein n=1 Tax=Aspergillus ellipticus CBS 707.79 TaxID=1448320 RepID=A0A319CTK1_9EURO|nr:hypothetical protein BO71DRAFT_404321 [Aspergillus ellipticus CBS 707.79]
MGISTQRRTPPTAAAPGCYLSHGASASGRQIALYDAASGLCCAGSALGLSQPLASITAGSGKIQPGLLRTYLLVPSSSTYLDSTLTGCLSSPTSKSGWTGHEGTPWTHGQIRSSNFHRQRLGRPLNSPRGPTAAIPGTGLCANVVLSPISGALVSSSSVWREAGSSERGEEQGKGGDNKGTHQGTHNVTTRTQALASEPWYRIARDTGRLTVTLRRRGGWDGICIIDAASTDGITRGKSQMSRVANQRASHPGCSSGRGGEAWFADDIPRA